MLVPYSSVAVRLHLALFYFYGRYYQWSKRNTGAQNTFRLDAGVFFDGLNGPRLHVISILGDKLLYAAHDFLLM